MTNGFPPYQNGYGSGSGGWPQNSPFSPQVPYWETPQWQEKKKIRHTSNVLGWANFAVQALMVGLSLLFSRFLLMVGYPFSGDYMSSAGMTPTMYYLLVSAVYIIAVALPFLLCVRFMHLPVNETFRFEKVGVGTSILLVLFGAGFCMFTNIPANIIAVILQESGISGPMPDIVSAETPFAIILSALQIAVIPPLVEELAFRGVILSQLRKFGDGFAVLGSALLFAFYHGNLMQFAFTFLVGLILAFIMVRTNNLWIPIVIHAINNGVSLLFDLVGSYISDAAYQTLNEVIFYGLILLGIVSLVLLARRNRGFFRRRYVTGLLPFSTRMWAFVSNPGFVAFFVFFLFSCIGNA